MGFEEKVKALEEARKKMEQKIAAARKEYIETKLKLFPELKTAGIPPSQLGQIIEEKDKRIKELEEKLAALEKKIGGEHK